MFFGLTGKQARTLFTKRQIEVLKLRARGMSLGEIAKIIGTSRQNVSTILKAALTKLKLAEETVRLYRRLTAPVTIRVGRDEDLDEIVGRIYSEADRAGIHIKYDGPSLAVRLRALSGGKIVARRVLAPLEIGVTSDGDVLVWEV